MRANRYVWCTAHILAKVLRCCDTNSKKTVKYPNSMSVLINVPSNTQVKLIIAGNILQHPDMTNGIVLNKGKTAEYVDDILVQISMEELPDMQEFYRKYLPFTTHVVGLLNTAIVWERKCPNQDYLTFLAMNGDWKSDGTIVVLIQFSCYDLFVFTLEKSCGRLYKCLKETKLIDWKRNVLFYALLDEHSDTALKLIYDLDLPIKHIEKIDIWWMPINQALELDVECPDEVYIQSLNHNHIPIINEVWPHRFAGSESYLKTLVDLNGGSGIFLKSTNQLVAWVIKTHMGALGTLQTLTAHKRKGYGSLVTKALSKNIAEEGFCPIGTVLAHNIPSQNMFRGIGFEILHGCHFIQLEDRVDSHAEFMVKSKC